MKIAGKLALLAATLGFSIGHAMAATGSDASVVITGVQLIDLDANDGIAPGIIFSDIRNVVSTGVGRDIYGRQVGEYIGNREATALASSARLDGISGVAGNNGGAFGSLYAQGRISSQGNYLFEAFFANNFVLTPHTKLVLTGHADANRSVDPVASPSIERWSTALVDVSLRTVNYSREGGVAYRYLAGFNDGLNPNHYSQNFSFNFSNTGSQSLGGLFSARIYANGVNFDHAALPMPPTVPDTSPVPEPESWAMMLGGLAALGIVSRRTRR